MKKYSRNHVRRKMEEGFRMVLLIFFVASIYFILLYKRQNPSMMPLMPIRMVDQIVDGRKIVLKQTRVPIEQISNTMIYGVIAGEDQKFLDHRGFDGDALLRALVAAVNTQSLGFGGSSITQQTAKNVFLWPDRSLFRKAVEFYFAIMIELLRSKERILEVYLNIIEFGHGIYGVEQAARYYFDTSAAKLTQSQASFLVAMMPNPRYYQKNQRSYWLSSRKNIISKMVSNIKRHKDIKTFVEATKK